MSTKSPEYGMSKRDMDKYTDNVIQLDLSGNVISAQYTLSAFN